MAEKELIIYRGGFVTPLPLPFADTGIQAGFPSPAQDYIDKSLDFNRELIEHPAATFYAKVVGNSMIGAGISEGDIVVIDRAVDPEQDDVVVVFVDGEFTIKYIDFSELHHNRIWLRPANSDYKPIKVNANSEFRVWGVVVKVIKNFR